MKYKAIKYAAACVAVVCLSAALSIVQTGCTTDANGNTVIDTNTVDNTAIILRSAARDGAIIAIQDDPSSKGYFQLAATSISAFLTGKDYTPGSFQKALLVIDSKDLTNQWVQIGIGTTIDLYQLYYGQYVKGQVNSNEIARAFLTAIQDGFNQALGNAVSIQRYSIPLKISNKAALMRKTSVVPRPIN
jgi:hypothetical protein